MPRVSIPFRFALCLAAALALSSCGPESESPPPAVPSPPQPSLSLSDREKLAAHFHVDPAEAAGFVSTYRMSHGLSAVVPDPTLQKLAQEQANAMAQKNILSHEIIGTLKARYDAVDLSRTTAVENVSAGYFSLADALRGWRESPAHNANLLKPGMRKFGIATAYAPGTRFLLYWAVDMSN
ncbi:MAG TPA: CAP domain-containing protein [Methylovirgula sp.]